MIIYLIICFDWSFVKGGFFNYYNVMYLIIEVSFMWYEVVEWSYFWIDFVNFCGMINYSMKVGLMLEDGFIFWSEVVMSEIFEGGKE